jgi:hypothetical protein
MNRLRTRLRASIASGPLVLLDFISGGLDPRITFSRGSNATRVDATGKITYAPANLLTFSEQFENAAWVPSNISVTANAATAPDGTTTADLLTPSSTSAIIYQAHIAVATSYIYSVWLRSNTGSNVSLNISANGSGVIPNPTSTAITVTTQWQRFALPLSCAVGNSVNAIIGSTTVGTWPSGATIYAWGAQLEPVTYQTTPSTYVATTTAAYYGPRFDYDPVTLAAKGLLIEEQRTNVLTYSSTVGGTNWVVSAATATTNNAVAPDGTITAALITEASTNAAHAVYGTSISLLTNTYTASAYIKGGTRRYVSFRAEAAAGGTWAWVTLDTQTGSLAANAQVTSSSSTNAGNGWWRVTITWANTASNTNIVFAGSDVATAPAPSSTLGNVYLGNGSTFFVWGPQIELGAFATSYIPTVASQVTRSADVATMTGTNFSSWYNQSEGTLLVEASLKPNISGGMAALSIGSAIENMAIYSNPGAGGLFFEMRDNNTMQAAFTVALGSQPVKAAAAYATNNTNLAQNGTAQTTDTSCTVPTVDRLLIGAIYAAGDYPTNGHIRQIAYYNTRLPNATLQALTA